MKLKSSSLTSVALLFCLLYSGNMVSTRNKRLSIQDESSSNKVSRLGRDESPPPPLTFLDWRTAPEKSFSDWKIEIVSQSGDGETTIKGTYHVHKSVLVVESKYFQNLLFQNDGIGSFTESKTATSRIELVAEGAASFGDFLDYMYRLGEPKLTSDNATAMHHFGEYFGMNRLRCLAGRFWEADLSSDNVATYYKHAGIFHDDEIMQAVKEHCFEMIRSRSRGYRFYMSHLLVVPDPQVWLYLLEKDNGANSKDTSSHWKDLLEVPDPQVWLYLLEKDNGANSKDTSSLISTFCTRHDVDPVTFASLTEKKVLPVIDFTVARQLVEQEKDIIGGDGSLTFWRYVNAEAGGCDFLSSQSPEFSTELYKRTLLAATASTSM